MNQTLTLTNTSPNILLVEDNPGDILLAKEVFSRSNMKNNLFIAKDGEEAIYFLKKQNKFEGVITPDLILLDLNLPKKDGCEVLTEIKEDPNLMFIPVIIFTTSSSDKDILRTYAHHANCFITKPADFHEFTGVIRSIESFWFSTVKLPKA
jgi:two-component system, chemotaxis family, response regulator Rcp1